MDDFDLPNTKPGYCPECSRPANIWNMTHNRWACSYCNWEGVLPDAEPTIKTMYLEDYACLRNF